MTELDPATLDWLRYKTEHALQMLAARLNVLHGFVLAQVVCEAHPEPPVALVAELDRLRANLPDNWRVIAWEQGVWRSLFDDARHARERGCRADVVDVFERWAVELSEVRYPGMLPGHIHWTAVSPTLRARKRTVVKADPTRHLTFVSTVIDKTHYGELALSETPGEQGTLRITFERDGKSVTVEETFARPMAWTKWVHASLDRLANLVSDARNSRASRAIKVSRARSRPRAARRRSRA